MNAKDGGPSDEERTLEFLVGRFPPGGTAREPDDCPDRNLMAGLADGTLLPEERRSLENHLARCEFCGRLASELVRGGAGEQERPEEDRPRRRRVITWPRMVLAAASLVAIVGAGWWLRQLKTAPTGTEAWLQQVAQRLVEERPALFAGFHPLSPDELRARPPVARGGIELGFPVGKVIERRPVFRWRTAPGVTRWSVTLRRQEGTLLWTESSRETKLTYPTKGAALEPGGTYLWEVQGKSPLGTVDGARAFTVATDQERRRFENACGEIQRLADPGVALLVTAHYAVRRDFLGEAERAARAAWRRRADDPIVRETLVYVLRQLKSSDVDWIEKRKGRSIEKD